MSESAKQTSTIPEPPPTLPSRKNFLLCFGAITAAGFLGGIIGYGIADASCTGNCFVTKSIGATIGATLAAVGVGVVTVLVLQAMSEWQTHHSSPRGIETRRNDSA